MTIYRFTCGQRAGVAQSPDHRSNGEAWPMGESPPEAPRTLSRSEILGTLMLKAGCERNATQCALSDPRGAGADGDLRRRLAGLCYDTPPGEAMLFSVAVPDKTPWTLSEDF